MSRPAQEGGAALFDILLARGKRVPARFGREIQRSLRVTRPRSAMSGPYLFWVAQALIGPVANEDGSPDIINLLQLEMALDNLATVGVDEGTAIIELYKDSPEPFWHALAGILQAIRAQAA